MAHKLNKATEELMKSSGIKEGFRVLDVGCGHGEVSVLLSKLVGPKGEVVGIDRSEKMLQMAREKLSENNLTNATFHNCDLDQAFDLDLSLFDAVFGRRVLMYLPNPTETLKKFALIMKPNGIIAFQEADFTFSNTSTRELPLFTKVNNWFRDTVKAEGGDLKIGFKLPSIFSEGGFKVDSIEATADIEGQSTRLPPHALAKVMLPRIVEHGVATEEEMDLDTLEERLNAEKTETDIFINGMSFQVYGHKL